MSAVTPATVPGGTVSQAPCTGPAAVPVGAAADADGEATAGTTAALRARTLPAKVVAIFAPMLMGVSPWSVVHEPVSGA
ncbi:hypothetical protein GCM10010246_49210 [Streptomyces cuspidosporus]|uniref:Uncharacterized protein n=1 Tax=Streptomyces cuspidosporus TaxID=66882 RepID=A0ABP5TJF1_9ACTN